MIRLARRLIIALVLAGAGALVAAGSALADRHMQVERVVSAGGVEAWLIPDHANPIIAVRIAFRGGAALDPAGKEGLANMASALIDEGAGDLDSQAFQRRLEDLAVTLRFNAGRDTFSGGLRTLTEHRDQAFDLLRLALSAARFDDEPVARIRQQILAGLRADSEDPGFVARRTLAKILFPDHPYGRPVRGTAASVGAVTVSDLRRFVKQRLARDNMVIGVVGDIDPAVLAPLLDSTFGGLPATAASATVADASPATTGETIVVEKPVPQSAILFAHDGLMRNDPDFYVAYVINHVLGGGGFTSRLYDEVREKRGLAYSIGSGLYPLDHAALIMGSAGTANKNVADTVRLVRREWRALAADGMTQAELDDAKTFLTGSFPLRFSSSERIARMLVGMQREGLGIDYLKKRNGYIDAVNLDDVRRVAGHLLDADKLTMVIVGQPEGLPGTD